MSAEWEGVMATDRKSISFLVDRTQGSITGRAKAGGDVTIILNSKQH